MGLISREQINDAVVVWIARNSEAPDLSRLVHLLDKRDLERAARFRQVEDRTRFVLGRSTIRHALGLCAGIKPESVRLSYESRDRPIFAVDKSIHFSISHTHNIVALAVTANARVGIDFEFMKPLVDLDELAERILSETDLQNYKELPRPEAVNAFFRAWTRKEAYLKARGEGIGDGLKAVSVSMGEETISPLTDARNVAGSEAWRIHNLIVSPKYMGALACDAPTRRVVLSDVRFVQDESGAGIKLMPKKP